MDIADRQATFTAWGNEAVMTFEEVIAGETRFSHRQG
jgi:hypothetical protein